ncbi:hypothetical protein GCM10010400_03310 [Streptomyces aculeolatus]|uniref:hypothetical protein n=1 Tax=Streptomyces aculeolatus TaxID=270689 RepID=UPI001CED9555|nr:hypothetical protein [Streptomyces aculeolatus]
MGLELSAAVKRWRPAPRRPKVVDDDMLTFAVAIKARGTAVLETAKKLTIKIGKSGQGVGH